MTFSPASSLKEPAQFPSGPLRPLGAARASQPAHPVSLASSPYPDETCPPSGGVTLARAERLPCASVGLDPHR